MSIISVSEFRKNIYNILKNVTKTHEPIIITSKNNKNAAVIVSQKNWDDIMETLFFLSHKDARDTIINELKKPIEEGVEINWNNGE
jgi:prevent-host-death family protein